MCNYKFGCRGKNISAFIFSRSFWQGSSSFLKGLWLWLLSWNNFSGGAEAILECLAKTASFVIICDNSMWRNQKKPCFSRLLLKNGSGSSEQIMYQKEQRQSLNGITIIYIMGSSLFYIKEWFLLKISSTTHEMIQSLEKNF